MNKSLLLSIFALGFAATQGHAQTALNQYASRVVGQPSLSFRSINPNVVEGREFYNPWSVSVDTTSSAGPLYVADTLNNRVLAWRNAATFSNGSAADLVIGQLDFQSTVPQGSGQQTGLTLPTGLVVDRNGNLFVVDTGNNRILRFPRPFASTDVPRTPDLVIGQNSFATNQPNAGGGPTASTIAVSSSGTIARSGLAFDTQGNLWFTDALNHRVLRYPAVALAGGARSGLAADLVLGQPNLTSNAQPQGAAADLRGSRATLQTPGSITIDGQNRVYVGDDLSRVLVFTPNYFSGKEADRIVGIYIVPRGEQFSFNEYYIGQAEGLFMYGDRLGVVDTGLNRIAIYDPYTQWAAPTDALPSPPARIILGQPAFSSVQPNSGLAEAAANTLNAPLGAFYNGSQLFVADSGNNRVLAFSSFVTGASATRVLGQINFNFFAPNLTEGKELYLYAPNVSQTAQLQAGGAIVIDNSTATPRLYIADTFNNRILGYRDARRVRPGDAADIVIGQNDFNRTLVNAPQNSNVPSDTGLFRPIGLAIDKNGDLFVADAGNARVLRFPVPFTNYRPGERQRPNLVIGQPDFGSRITDPSASRLAYPYGVALTNEGHLVVSDTVQNRVLYFRRASGGDFTNGQSAEKVFGQRDFFSTTGSGLYIMNGPAHLAIDTDDRMYVADAGNNRVLVYDRITVAAPTNQSAAFVLAGLSSPQGIWVSPDTGEIWVADFRNQPGRVLRYPRFDFLARSTNPDYSIPSTGPLAVTQDRFGNLYVAEASNRIAIYYNGIATQVGGNFLSRPLSPGSFAILYPSDSGVSFGSRTETAGTLPLSTQLADTQVLLNDRPVPLYYVSPKQINFLVPMDAPDNGIVEYQVTQLSTGQTLATGLVETQRVSPALFAINGQQGQLAALNEDNTVNGPGAPLARGKIIQIFGTGQGRVANAPPDGAAATGPVPTEKPRILLGSTGNEFVSDADITYSGLAPGLPGVWQINFRIPQSTAPGSAVEVVVQLGSQYSNGAGFLTGNNRLRTTIAVSP